MASQVAHIVYAKKYLDKHPRKDADNFLLGTLFPDVRRIADELSRHETHIFFKHLDLDFNDLTGFQSGWKFHLWCDMRRYEILNKYNFLNIKNAATFGGMTARLLEDEILYEKYNNWEKLSLLLNNPPTITTPLDVSQETLERWYAIVSKYFEKKPSDKTIKIFLCKQPSMKNEADGIIDALGKLRNNSKAVGILKKVVEEII